MFGFVQAMSRYVRREVSCLSLTGKLLFSLVLHDTINATSLCLWFLLLSNISTVNIFGILDIWVYSYKDSHWHYFILLTIPSTWFFNFNKVVEFGWADKEAMFSGNFMFTSLKSEVKPAGHRWVFVGSCSRFIIEKAKLKNHCQS